IKQSQSQSVDAKYDAALDEFCALMKLHQPCLEKVLLSGDDPRLHQIKQDVDKIMDIPSEFNSDMNRDGRDQMRREEEYNWGDIQLTSEIVSKSCCEENMSSNKSGFPGLGTSYSHEKCSGGPLFNSENQINQNTSIQSQVGSKQSYSLIRNGKIDNYYAALV
ncbi:MAG: hypothetical protein EZS28_051406, partial [Streblomastix strix]